MKKAIKSVNKVTTNYYKPTPKRWRKIGDSIMGLGTLITGISAFTLPPYITLIASVITYIGKTITNFATDD